jgi:hypothetical protein
MIIRTSSLGQEIARLKYSCRSGKPLGDSISTKLSLERRVKTQNDIGGRNSLLAQNLGDRHFRPIVLNPDFAILNIKVKNNAKNALPIFPAHISELIAIVFGIANYLRLDIIRMSIRMSLFG